MTVLPAGASLRTLPLLPPRRRALLRPCAARGFSLVELVVVTAVLVAVAGLVLTSVGGTVTEAEDAATATSLRRIADAITGTETFPGYVADVGALPPGTDALFVRPASVAAWDPVTRRGWRGPYLRAPGARYVVDDARGFTTLYAAADAPVPADGHGRPIVLQVPDRDGVGPPTADELRHVRLVSSGADGVLDTPRTDATAGGDALLPSRALCDDDVVLFLRVPDTRP